MRYLALFLFFRLIDFPTSLPAQEYYRSPVIKPDSVAEGTTSFLNRLRLGNAKQNSEDIRLYRDSLLAALIRADTIFKNQKNLVPAQLNSLLPHRSYKLISDLLWNEFILSADKTAAVTNLAVIASKYPAEEFVQGNLTLAYSILNKQDSAEAVVARYLKLKHEGFSSLDIAVAILRNGPDRETGNIMNLRADSFKIWSENKLYKFPANVDSMRNALAAIIFQRATAIPAPDHITGRLIVDFADLTVKDKFYNQALPFYDIALSYDAKLQPIISERKQVIAAAGKSVDDTFKWASIFYAIPLLSFVLIIVGWLRNRSKNHGGNPTS